MTRAQISPDIAGYGRNGDLTLVVEVKALSGKPPGWAEQLRRDMCAEGYVPTTRFWMLALRDRIHLWVAPHASERKCLPPDYSADPPPRLAGTAAAGSAALEVAVSTWLNELLWTPAAAVPAAERWVVESGLHAALQGGQVLLRTVAA